MGVKSATSTRAFTIGDCSVNQGKTILHDRSATATKNVGAAKSGTLTTRTNNTDGTMTMTSGHGINTGDKVDIFWEGGSRYNVTVGTVSTNSVPISSGSGDNLPSQSTALKVCVPLVSDLLVDGDDVVVGAIFCANRARATFFDASNAVLLTKEVKEGMIYGWDENEGTTNPFATLDIAYVKVSQGGAVAADVKIGLALRDS